MAFVNSKSIRHFDDTYTGAQTATALVTPSSGKRLLVWGFSVWTSVDAVVKVFFGSDADNKRLFNHKVKQDTVNGWNFPVPIYGAVDEVLKLTTSTGNSNVVVFYMEE